MRKPKRRDKKIKREKKKATGARSNPLNLYKPPRYGRNTVKN
jgi:hypothetical protein